MEQDNFDADSLNGSKIVAASSSLKNFAIALGDGRGISLEAVNSEGEPRIQGEIVASEKLPPLHEAVCSVDWGWILGSAINKVSVSGKMVRLQLDPAGVLNVSVGTWQGSPFLSFQPYKPVNK